MEQDEPNELPDLLAILDEPPVPAKQFCKEMGFGMTSGDNHSKNGLITEWIYFGAGKLKGQPAHDARIQIAARDAGLSNEEKRKLVQRLMKARTERFNSLAKQYKVAA